MEGKRTVPSFCFSFADHLVRLTTSAERYEIQKLLDAMFEVFFIARELCRYVKRVEDCERLATERA